MNRAYKLLNPGPVTLTERVRGALARPDLCHREPEAADLMADVRTRLLDLYDATRAGGYEAVLLSGSGTAAVEAMVGSFVPRGGRAIVVENGVYGERISRMLRAQGKDAVRVSAPWHAPIDVAAVERALDEAAASAPPISAVLVVHHETTTARLNDLASLGVLCRARRVPLLVDAVSSFGAEELRFAEWGIAACAATANKCLHGVPGIAFVVAQRELFEGESGATSVYLDLFAYEAAQRARSTPFTPAVQPLFALQEALRELVDAGGVPARRALYTARSTKLRAGFARLGFAPLLEDGAFAASFTSFRLPPGLSYARLHDELKEAGFIIYAGQGRFEHEIVRVSVMGALEDPDLDALLATTERIVSTARVQGSAEART